jgi:hypothetical protein
LSLLKKFDQFYSMSFKEICYPPQIPSIGYAI